jgi:RNA polymerase sigma-70 factor (ECF subfamily)
VFVGDGGGVKQAAPLPIVGADAVARLFTRGITQFTDLAVEAAEVNGQPALVLALNGQVDTVVAVRIDNGLIAGLYAVRNPAKLSHMDRPTALRR